MTVFDVPIEPLEERYSADWHQWFEEAYNLEEVRWHRVEGEELTKEIEVGVFLDVFGTNYYKASQLQQIMYLFHKDIVKEGDIFLFHDLWFPGLEMLAYVRDALDLRFKIYGLLHAGTYDPYDFLAQCGMYHWGKELENSWFKIVDGIFVATEFHKELLHRGRIVRPSKIHVTGFPIKDCAHEPPIRRWELNKDANRVVFPHRLDPEKNPQKFDVLRRQFKHWRDWEFVRTKDLNLSKKEYYEILADSTISVSFADQETWGIAMQESVFSGCLPLVPDRLSYRELYPSAFRYDSIEEMLERLRRMMIEPMAFEESWSSLKSELLAKGEEAIPNMLRIMGVLND